jgi:ribonuclease P protein component
VVVHLAEDREGDAQPQVGFVVSKAVGNAVHRNLVKRRLRAATASRLGALPPYGRAVVRALPPSSSATFDELSSDLSRGLDRAVVRLRDRESVRR